MDDAPAPVELAAPPDGIQVGDRVSIEGEVRGIGETGHLVKFESGYGLIQYVWVKFKHLFKAPPDSSR